MVKTTLAAATLIVGALVAVPASASASTSDSADVLSCKAVYQITNTWPASSTRDGISLGQVTVQNTGSSPMKGWRVSWRYADGTTITQVWGAVPLPVIGPVGTQAFGNETYNGELAVRGSTVFGFATRGPVPAETPDPVVCTPL
ncbi:cellulose binding domain-containing protein [Sphaerimonospora sp. CA-214678]|uniref:cellulose binding domain-containing protein n=1 Tax=Sphaerimonospora sp. CA-214678 TaxID=3240029 RepID=UPI003D8EC642